MSENELIMILNKWYADRRQAYGIPEGKELATTADKAAVKRWLAAYGLATVNAAICDVILKGRKVAGYQPKLRHVGQILRRDYQPLAKRRPEETPAEKRFIGQAPPPGRDPAHPEIIL